MRADKPLLVAAAVLGCAVAPGAWSQSAADCANLVSLKLPDTADLTAAVVEGSKFTPPAQGNPAPAARNVQGTLFASLPAFCRVTGGDQAGRALRGVAADERLEWQIPGHRQRRL